MIKGIDTSKWQNHKVDYAKAKASGYSFVFLRIGSGSAKDKCFDADYENAKRSGLKIGVYFYTYSTDNAGAQRDARNVLKWLGGRALDLPIAYDIEDDCQKGTSRKRKNAEMLDTFSNGLGAYQCMLYTGESFFNTYFEKSLVKLPLWIAKYSSKTPNVGMPISIWQYTSGANASDFYKEKLDRNYIVNDIFGFGSTTTTYPAPTRTLKRGCTGEDVKWLQTKLSISADGIFGAQTEKSVKSFQQKNGLICDGIVGVKTLSKLLQ